MIESIQLETQIQGLYKEIEAKRQDLVDLLKQRPEEEVTDHTLKDFDGNEVMLSSLFGESDELLLIHNMGKGCVYCTLWADGFNGLKEHIGNRTPFVLISPDPPAVQKEFANSRGWGFPMLSDEGGPLTAALGMKTDQGYMPGVSSLVRRGDKIFRVAKDYFGPGDMYNPVWHFFDLLAQGKNEWAPKYSYKS